MPNSRELVLKHALLNAVEYNGKASAGAVVGKVVAEAPELKKDMGGLGREVAEVVKEVNSWSLEKQKKELEKFGKIEKPKKQEREGLPELPGVKGKVVMRMAPNANGPPHIGHTRMLILNDEYVKKYRGKLILRFDDTDPKNENKIPFKEAYKWFEEDLKWLGIKYSKVVRASERLERYYEVFREVLKGGFGYVCICAQEEWKNKVRIDRGVCPCRELGVEENLERWEKVLKWEFKEGQAVGRVKTSLEEKDPAVLDWVAFRIVDNPQHPFSKAHVWPMLDFASAVDDKDFKVTHIIRGKDLAISEKRQRILYNHLGWSYPETKVYGKFVTTPELILSKSKIAEGIRNEIYTGWDDPRLATLKAFRKRGIQPEAIRNYIIKLGLSEAETSVDLNILYSENKDVIDKKSNRFFFVAEPIEINLDKLPIRTVKAPVYPGKRRYRKIPVSKKIFVDKLDFIGNRGKEARLMHFCNIILDSFSKVTGKGLKDIPKIHWVPAKNVPISLIMPNNRRVEGLAEPEIKKVKVDETIQLERVGFCRVDEIKPRIVLYYAHK